MAQSGLLEWPAFHAYTYILLSIQEGRHTTTPDVAATLSLSERHTNRVINKLLSAGLVQRIRQGRGFRFVIPNLATNAEPAPDDRRVKVQAPDEWVSVFRRYRRPDAGSAMIRESQAAKLRQFLQQHKPDALTMRAMETFTSKKVPLAYLASLVNDAGNIDPSFLQPTKRPQSVSPAMVDQQYKKPVPPENRKDTAELFSKPLFPNGEKT